MAQPLKTRHQNSKNGLNSKFQEQYTSATGLVKIFERHQEFYKLNPYPSFEYRSHLLQKLKDELIARKDFLCNAAHQDFGNRCAYETLFLEIMQVIDHISHTQRHLKGWMKAEHRILPIQLMPGSSSLLPQPKGIIGIIAPWNFPILLSLAPLVTAISAGNTAMVKGSELTPETNACLDELCHQVFDGKNASFIQGDVNLAEKFTALPFHHLFFTGSPEIGKKVMAAAAQNLTSVTLELGGKSPVIIDPNYDIRKAAAAITFGKSMNAGQTCIAPDYILCPAEKVDALIIEMKKSYETMYPNPIDNEDYTSIISELHFQRLIDLLNDASSQQAVLHPLSSGINESTQKKKIPLTLVTGTKPEMRLMQEEIFGPILPIIPINSIDEAITYIENNPPPLALYLMSDSPKIQNKVSQETHAGGMCINDILTHVASQNLPFGGLGQSGIGHYHGREGFLELSHQKSILKRGRWNPTLLIAPPWNKKIHQMVLKLFLK